MSSDGVETMCSAPEMLAAVTPREKAEPVISQQDRSSWDSRGSPGNAKQ